MFTAEQDPLQREKDEETAEYLRWEERKKACIEEHTSRHDTLDRPTKLRFSIHDTFSEVGVEHSELTSADIADLIMRLIPTMGFGLVNVQEALYERLGEYLLEMESGPDEEMEKCCEQGYSEYFPQVGDYCAVIKAGAGSTHGFEAGDEVRVIEVMPRESGDDLYCCDKEGLTQWLRGSELSITRRVVGEGCVKKLCVGQETLVRVNYDTPSDYWYAEHRGSEFLVRGYREGDKIGIWTAEGVTEEDVWYLVTPIEPHTEYGDSTGWGILKKHCTVL